MRRILIALLLVAFCLGNAQAQPLQLLAAGSLAETMADMARAYTAAQFTPVEMHFGPSGLLRRQIERGAAVDVFASASLDHAETLSKAGVSGPAVVFTRNRFCAFAKPGIGLTADNLLDKMLDPNIKLMTSTPKSDPSGDYAWAMFKRAEAIRPGAEKALQAKALQLVGGPNSAEPPKGVNVVAWHFNEGRADMSVGYCTSAASTAREVPGMQILELPPSLAVAADYGLTVVSRRPEAGGLAMFILSPPGQAILAQHGFATVTAPVTP
jgi:molybdenum ABC transporter molybdate-binding protein